MEPRVVDGDLLDQDVEVIVNAWNRNIIPWWLLLPQGVSRIRPIKRRGGLRPFREPWVAKRLFPLRWCFTSKPARRGGVPLKSTRPWLPASACSGAPPNARSAARRSAIRVAIAKEKGYRSIAFPLIGAGSGGGSPAKVLEIMCDELWSLQYDGEVRIVRYR